MDGASYKGVGILTSAGQTERFSASQRIPFQRFIKAATSRGRGQVRQVKTFAIASFSSKVCV